MIHDIKQIVLENAQCFNRGNFSVKDINVSKFFHGSPSTSTKVLFFISCKNAPLCIIKMARNTQSDDIIQREVEGMKHFNSAELPVPKLFFTGRLQGVRYVCQEIITGYPVGKNNETETFDLVAAYHNSVAKIRKIKIYLVLDAIKDLNIAGDREYEQVIRLLNERKGHDVYVADQHGDLTYKNIMKYKDGVVFIDFENFGLRSVWGNDITHYLTRMTNVYDIYKENKDVSETMERFVTITEKYRNTYTVGISDQMCADIFLLDLLFEDLQKTYAPERKEIITIMKNIWLT